MVSFSNKTLKSKFHLHLLIKNHWQLQAVYLSTQ